MEKAARVYVSSEGSGVQPAANHDRRSSVRMVQDQQKSGAKDSGEDGNRKQKCNVCGNYVEKLYQHNTCKQCLVSDFQRLKPVIDSVRARR